METLKDLGVHRHPGDAARRHLTGIAKRALRGVETFALKSPDQLDDGAGLLREAR